MCHLACSCCKSYIVLSPSSKHPPLRRLMFLCSFSEVSVARSLSFSRLVLCRYLLILMWNVRRSSPPCKSPKCVCLFTITPAHLCVHRRVNPLRPLTPVAFYIFFNVFPVTVRLNLLPLTTRSTSPLHLNLGRILSESVLLSCSSSLCSPLYLLYLLIR